MSGGIYFSDRSYWSAAGWLFDLVLESLEDSVRSETLREHIHEVAASGVGVLDAASFASTDETEFLRAVREDLRSSVANELLGATGIDVSRVMKHLEELVRLSGHP